MKENFHQEYITKEGKSVHQKYDLDLSSFKKENTFKLILKLFQYLFYYDALSHTLCKSISHTFTTLS